MRRDIFDNSLSVKSAKNSIGKYRIFENRVEELCESSFLIYIVRAGGSAFKRCLRQSLLNKITCQGDGPGTSFADSEVVGLSSRAVKKVNGRMADYFRASEIYFFIRSLIADLRMDILRTLTIIGITALIMNVIISMMMKIEIDLSGWLLRVAFILVGLAIITGASRWEDVKKTSFFVKIFK